MHSFIYVGILVLGIISNLSSTLVTKAQDDQVNYTEFLNCLSEAEVGGTVTENQVSNCFESVYNENGEGENAQEIDIARDIDPIVPESSFTEDDES
jgi:hypothetical protein